MDCLAITDEVYEHITFDGDVHVSLSSLPGMQQRTIITSSLSKTFSVTGWRIGWAIAPADIASAIKNIHVKITDSAPAPFQEAALTALSSPTAFFESLRDDYQGRRDYAVKMLEGAGFGVHLKPQGSFFIFAELPENSILTDVQFVEKLIKEAGIAAVPGCSFVHSRTALEHDSLEKDNYSEVLANSSNYQNRYVRFAFCKSDDTLNAAAYKLMEFVDAKRCLIMD